MEEFLKEDNSLGKLPEGACPLGLKEEPAAGITARPSAQCPSGAGEGGVRSTP